METWITQTIVYLAAVTVLSAIGIGVRSASATDSVGAYRVIVWMLFGLVLFPMLQATTILLAPDWIRLPAPAQGPQSPRYPSAQSRLPLPDAIESAAASPDARVESPAIAAVSSSAPNRGAWVMLLSYAGGIVFFGARRIRSIRGVRMILRHAKPVCDERVLRVWRCIAGADRRASGVRLMECDGLPSPACLGVIRPIVLIPENVLADTDEAGLNCALRHEWIHVRRMDAVVMHLQRLVETLLWFHPLVWRLSRRIDVYRELSCDALVVRETRNPKSYALALLDFCRRTTPFEGEPRSNRGYPAVAVANLAFVRAAPVVPVKRRIEMIAQSAANHRSGFALHMSVAGALLVTLGGAAVAGALAPRDQAKAAPHTADQGATRTLDLSRPGEPVTVTSGMDWGSYTVRPHDQASVTIHVSMKTETGLIQDETVFDTIDFYEEKPNQFVIDIDDLEEGEHVGYSIDIYTPVSSSVTLAMDRGGEIAVSGLDGTFTLASSNGSISLMEVSGSAAVATQNGSIEAEFLALHDGPIAMSSQNGSVDLTVPETLDAQVSMATQHGGVYSDFELENVAPPHGENFDGREGSKTWVSASDQAMNGVVGAGGPPISLATQHGAVYLRMGGGVKHRPNHAY